MIAGSDYEYLSQLLLKRSGLFLGPNKEYLLEARLIPVAQSCGLANIDALVSELRRPNNERLCSTVVEAMTTNETLFFRDKTPFDELRDRLLPQLHELRRNQRRLRFWSAAASTGQEAYSLAMLFRSMRLLDGWKIEILGTDISTQALARAEEGVYSQFEVQRGLPIQLLVENFDQVPNGWQIKKELRQWTKFQGLNLLENFSALGMFDVIFCRNVLIYFESDLKKVILERMVRMLNPGGYLVLGAAETVLGVTDVFERYRECRSAVYTGRASVPVRV